MIEHAFIGLAILEREGIIPACARVEPRQITEPCLQDCYREIRSIHAAGQWPDEATLITRLKPKHCDIEKILEKCLEMASDPDKAEEYADEIVQEYQTECRRKACRRYLEETFSGQEGAWRRLQDNLERADKLYQPRLTQEDLWAETLEDSARRVKRHREGKTAGIPWGYKELDHETGGIDSGINLIGGWSSSGKSSLLAASTIHWLELDYRVKFITLDMTHHVMAWRICAQRYGVKLAKFKRGNLNDHEIEQLHATVAWLMSKGFIVDRSCSTIEDVKASIIRDRDLADIFVIDYLQKIDTGAREEKESVRLAMTGLNAVGPAIDNKPRVVLTQFSNTPSKEELKAGICPVPNVGQIRAYKECEQMIDQAVFVWRSNHFIDDYKGEIQAALVLAKSQNTGKGKYPVGWNPDLAMFYDFTEDDLAVQGTLC